MIEKSTSDKKTAKKRINGKSWLVLLAILILIGLGSVVGVFAFVATDLPVWNEQNLTGFNATLLMDDKEQVFSRLHAEEDRTIITLDKVPPQLVQAFVATEDQGFYQHHGVNFKGIARAVLSNIQSRDLTGQGASTITQQLARNAFLTMDKTWQRKVKEILLAFKLESIYSKDEIMELYLNKIYFGAGAYGVQTAANNYFGKDISDLNLAESALLAGLVQSPSAYDPFHNFDAAKARQRVVLYSMSNCGYISNKTAHEAFVEEIHLVKANSSIARHGYFIDAVVDEAAEKLSQIKGYENGDSAIYRAGLRIYTTMDTALQDHAENYFLNQSNFPSETRDGQKIQVGMAIIDHQSGAIKSIMGGREYLQQRGFNRATDAYRQPGSSIKPLTVYSAALESGKMPFTVLDDSPISYKSAGGIWSPKNYDYKYRGLITMRTAVQWSINTYAVQLLDKIGIQKAFDMGKSLGLPLIDTPGKNDLALAPLSLGGLTRGVTPVQMAAAYGSFGNGGLYIEPHFITRIEDSNGVKIYEYKPQYTRAMSQETAWLMNNMLQTVVSSGTGTNARVPGIPTGGKTGTSEDNRDCWFCGFTPMYSSAVWMGYDAKINMRSQYGGGYPAKLVKSMLQKAHENKKSPTWSKPKDIVQVRVCSKSGKLPGDTCGQEDIIREFCLKKYIPTEKCNQHQTLLICKESGKLAGKYCPETELRTYVTTNDKSSDPNKIPTEVCDIHTEFTIPGLFKNTVWVCRDPRHQGTLYRANIPNSNQTGGCPTEYLEEIQLLPGQNLPVCPLTEHQVTGN